MLMYDSAVVVAARARAHAHNIFFLDHTIMTCILIRGGRKLNIQEIVTVIHEMSDRVNSYDTRYAQ